MRKAFHQMRNYFQGAGHGHSDFHDGNAPASNHFGGEKGIFRGRSADGRNDSNFLNLGADLILVQRVSSEMLPASRVKVNSWASMICVKLWVSAPWMISFTTWHETGQEHAGGRIAARFSDSDDMRAGNPNSFARRIGLWAFAAFSMLLAQRDERVPRPVALCERRAILRSPISMEITARISPAFMSVKAVCRIRATGSHSNSVAASAQP